MPKRLYVCRVSLEFVVAADDQDDALMLAEEAMHEEVVDAQPEVVREVTSESELSHRLRGRIPYGSDAQTCGEILEQEDGE